MSLVYVRSASGANVTLSDGTTTVGVIPVLIDNNSANFQNGLNSGQIVEVGNSVVEIILSLARITQNVQITTEKSSLVQALTNQSVTAGAWMNGPVQSCDGYKTLIADFTWGAFSMVNSSNYVVAWFIDVAGTQQVAVDQWGTSTSPFNTNTLQVKAPYYQLQAKNTDTAAHTVNAWAYLMPE